jgi:hypothetical protein
VFIKKYFTHSLRGHLCNIAQLGKNEMGGAVNQSDANLIHRVVISKGDLSRWQRERPIQSSENRTVRDTT